MAIKFEDTPAPKGKPAEKPVEKARPAAKEEKPPSDALPAKAEAKGAKAKPAKIARKS